LALPDWGVGVSIAADAAMLCPYGANNAARLEPRGGQSRGGSRAAALEPGYGQVGRGSGPPLLKTPGEAVVY
jgi:hypothetical protein